MNRDPRSEDLDKLLEDIQVDAPGVWSNDTGPKDWWAVSAPNDGILAYFAYEEDALAFRLHLINRVLNPIPLERTV